MYQELRQAGRAKAEASPRQWHLRDLESNVDVGAEAQERAIWERSAKTGHDATFQTATVHFTGLALRDHHHARITTIRRRDWLRCRPSILFTGGSRGGSNHRRKLVS
jgi:hypothetical protein